MAELKTKKTELDVNSFLRQISDEQKQKDAFIILGLMEDAAKAKGKMWGTSFMGFKGIKHRIRKILLSLFFLLKL